MKRYLLSPVTTVDGVRTPTVPPGTTGWVNLHDFGNRMLIKAVLPDGTPKTVNTIADITLEAELDENGEPSGQQRQVEVNAEPLTPAQLTAVRSFLESNGIDTSTFDEDGVVDRAQLLKFLLRRAAKWQDMTARELLENWDVA